MLEKYCYDAPMVGRYLALILMLLGLGVATCAVIVLAMAIAILRPPRMTDGKAVWVLKRLSPGDLGLRFEDISFTVRDAQTGRPMRLAGWWIPRPSARGRCVILLHGYADAKVGAIGWAPMCHSMDFNILAIDLRAHGESQGVYSTAGYWERHDLDQMIDQLRAQRPADAGKIVLLGVNLGAAAAAATAAMRDDISAVVLVDPFADFRGAAMRQMDLAGAPGKPFQTCAMSFAERIAGCDFSAVRPLETVHAIRCPIMMIASSCELPEIDPDRSSMEQAIRSRGRSDDEIHLTGGADRTPLPLENPGSEMSLRKFLSGLRE